MKTDIFDGWNRTKEREIIKNSLRQWSLRRNSLRDLLLRNETKDYPAKPN